MELDNIRGRLIIEKVILKNFKSYAGEKVIGPFHKYLTSVVGPNGSGKSNLLESLLFAFGKRARKMRLKKLSELIHHSNAHPNLTEASVEVYFENIEDTESGYTTVPGSKLLLTRTVKINSTSEYKLNNRLSTYEEVTSTLKHRGIDLEHNRFLILQGEVEQIAMMKPKAPIGDENKTGLLEYLEEIIGTDQYVPDIERAEKELETVGDDIVAKKVRFEEAKKIIEQLEEPMKEAVAYIELEKESYDFKCLKYRLENFAKVNLSNKVLEDIQNQQNKLLELDELFEEKKRQNKSAIEEYERKEKEMHNIKKLHGKMGIEIKEIISEETKLFQEFKQNKASVKQSEEEKEKIIKTCNEINEDIESLEKKIPELEEKYSIAKEMRIDKEKEFQEQTINVNQITEPLQRQKNSIEQEIKPLNRELVRSKTEKDSKTQEIELMTKDIQTTEQEKQKISAALKELNDEISQKNSELQEKKNSYQSKSTLITEKNKILLRICKEIDDILKTRSQITQKIENYEKEERRVLESRDKTIQILKAKKDRELSGVCGRLGDLGQIPEKFDVAVSSAFGSLDNYVVETVSQANDLISFVRAKNLGKINISILEKLQVDPSKMNNFQTPDSKALRLFDQIRFSEDRYRVAFYSVFGDTLFTDSMDDARRIAFGERRYKVVTRDGNIINPSGEMRGFANSLRGKMRLLGQPMTNVPSDDIQDLKSQLKDVLEKLEKLNTDKAKIESELSSDKTNDRQATQQILILENDIGTKFQRIRTHEERLKVINTRSLDEMRSNIDKLAGFVEKCENTIKKFEQLIEQKNKTLKDIETQIENAAGYDFKTLKDTLNKLQNNEDSIEKDLIKSTASLAQKKKDLDKYTKQLQKNTLEIDALFNRKQEIDKIRADYKNKAEELASKIETLSQKIEEQEKIIKLLREEESVISKQFEDIAKAREEIKSNKKQLTETLKQLQLEIQRCKVKLDQTITEYNSLNEEYSSVLTGMDLEDPNSTNLDHQSKKSKTHEDRINLRKSVSWEYTEEDLLSLFPKFKQIEEIEKIIEAELSSARPNLKIIQDYKARSLEKSDKENALNEAKLQENELKTLYTDYKNKRLTEFNKGFREISNKLRDMYRLITRGGDAELELADSTDPFSEGIVFTVRPPSKSWKKMANLSGGEKTLSSLALVFALHHYKPNALYVMDEVDAALDFQNVSVIASYIKGQTRNAQFIVVSLRYQMFEVADQLVGVYKTKDVSHSLCISPYSLKEVSTSNQIIKQTIENITIKEN